MIHKDYAYLLRRIRIHEQKPQFAHDFGSKLCIHFDRSRYTIELATQREQFRFKDIVDLTTGEVRTGDICGGGLYRALLGA